MKTFYFFILAMMFSCANAFCQTFDILNIDSESIVIVGDYKQLLEYSGKPDTTVPSHVGYTCYSSMADSTIQTTKEFKLVDVIFLSYGNSMRYIFIKDSVQLVDLYFFNTNTKIKYKDLVIDKNLDFNDAIDFFGLENDYMKYYSEESFGDSIIETYTFGLPINNHEKYTDYIWFSFLCQTDKLWHVELPLRFEGGLIR